MNKDLDNRWSDAARLASLAVRQARTLMGRPVNDGQRAKPRKAKSSPKPVLDLFAGGSANFDERTGTRKTPEINIWIPPPDAPEWNDPKFVESFKRGIAERKKGELQTATFPIKPNIYYSSTGPKGPLDRQTPQGILRYDPTRPNMAEELGYNMGDGYKKSKAQTKTLPKPTPNGSRVIIGGKIYIRVGKRMIPYRKSLLASKKP